MKGMLYIMKAAVWYGQKDVRVEDREPKELKDNEVKVKSILGWYLWY